MSSKRFTRIRQEKWFETFETRAISLYEALKSLQSVRGMS